MTVANSYPYSTPLAFCPHMAARGKVLFFSEIPYNVLGP